MSSSSIALRPPAPFDGAESVRRRLDALVNSGGVPGLQYVAVDRAGIFCEHAAGWADLARRVPMTAGTTLMAYSMSKTLTAVAVLRLVQQGRLGLGDAAAEWIDAWPYDPEVTIAELIAHTGGVVNPLPLRWVHPAAAHADFDERAALTAVLAAHPRLASPPGTRFRYSNLGYWLLGSVVERASGRRFVDFVREQIVSPLGIAPAELDYVVSDPALHAEGYLEKYSLFNLAKGFLIDGALIGGYSGRWLRIAPHYLNGPAFGGLVGTARSFARFLQDELGERSAVLDRPTGALLYEIQHTRNGRAVPMTLGWHARETPFGNVFFKEGGGGGFHCMMRLYRSAGVGTVLMTNATGFDVSSALDALDAPCLAEARGGLATP